MKRARKIRLIALAVLVAVMIICAAAAYLVNRPFEGPYSHLTPREKLDRFLKGGDVVLNLAHAGLKDFAPKDSMSAFRRAYEMGSDGVELDVVRCKTGELIVHHDYTFERSAGDNRHVMETTLADIRKLKLKPRAFRRKFSNEKIPTLEEVFQTFGDRMIVFVEVKNEGGKTYGAEMEAARLILKYGLVGTCMVSSFEPAVIANLGEKYPQLHTVLEIYDLPDNYKNIYPETSYPYSISLRKDYVTPEFVKWAGKKFRGVSTFTPNRRDEIERLIQCGVTLFQTDRPGKLAKILNEYKKN